MFTAVKLRNARPADDGVGHDYPVIRLEISVSTNYKGYLDFTFAVGDIFDSSLNNLEDIEMVPQKSLTQKSRMAAIYRTAIEAIVRYEAAERTKCMRRIEELNGLERAIHTELL
jgi:hypothetical protein